MRIAGVKVKERDILELAQELRRRGAHPTAETLEGSVLANSHTIQLGVLDRETILHALEDSPAGLEKLRGVLRRESTERRGV